MPKLLRRLAFPAVTQFLLYLLCVVLSGLVIAPAVYYVFGEVLEFHKLVLRGMEIGALICAYGWLRILGVSGAKSWGLRGPFTIGLRDLWYGWLLGVAMLSALVFLLLITGAREIHHTLEPDVVVIVLAKGMLIGLAVSVIEELWFRGALFTALSTAFSTGQSTGSVGGQSAVRPAVVNGAGWAVALSSLLYAAVHFLRPDQSIVSTDVQWWSSITVFFSSFARFCQPGAIIDSFMALFAAGVVLSVLRLRTQRIASCIGVHCGWVMVIYAAKKLSNPGNDSLGSALVGKYDGIIGWLAAALFSFVALYLYRRPGRTSSNDGR